MLGYVLVLTLVLTALSPVIFTDVFADSFSVNFDKEFYDLGDSLTVSGEIFDLGMPVIAMSIYDPDGKILSANNLEITSDQTFSKTIQLDSPFYEKTGQYLVKFDYEQTSENYPFTIQGGYLEPEILIEENTAPEILLLYTEQKQYTDKDVIKISGLVSTIDSPTVLIGIYDPFGMPAGFYFGAIDSNLEFTTSFLVKHGVNFRVDGTYSVKAHYAESEAKSFFDYSKVPQIIVTDSLDDETTEPEPEKTKQTPDVISEIENTSSKTQTTDTPQKTESVDTKIINTPQKTEINDDTLTKSIPKEIPVKKTIEPKNKVTKTIEENPISNKIKKENNLTVEDIELGTILNQIQLECDTSTYTDTISYYDGMGPALYRLCKFDSALNFFNESLIENPNDVEILVNKGSTLGKLGYFSEAIVFYDHALKINPDSLSAKNNKANALANLGQFDDAILLYNQVLYQNPNYLTATKNLKITTSLISDSSENRSDSMIENISHPESSSEKTNFEKQKPNSFIDEVSIAFSTLGSLFDFLN
ncbi:MAG: tetratricopeptide repeat protein [Nitrosopumilus sp.]|nr:tetratricopeptide repeat protein [Nitrosopumilus sp.]